MRVTAIGALEPAVLCGLPRGASAVAERRGYRMLRIAEATRSATDSGVAPRLKLRIQSASSGSDASTRQPLTSRKVSIAISAVRLFPSMNCWPSAIPCARTVAWSARSASW